MANFSAKERLIASLLSATPGLKRLVKDVYVRGNAVLYRKGYTNKILCDKMTKIENPLSGLDEESFFGYYDKCPINGKGVLLAHLSERDTRTKPSPDDSVRIVAVDIHSGKVTEIGKSVSYTWQQGARTQWLTDDKVIYNDFREGEYKSVVYSLKAGCELRTYDYPVQDSYGTDYFLSINYQRIMYLRPDYGYRNLPLPSAEEMRNLTNDGIWKIDCESGEGRLLYSLQDVVECGRKEAFASCLHKVNHVMINEGGDGFIFIHRYYQGKRRFDRLMYSDFKSLKVLVDDEMVSHCCWVDSDTIFGYFRYQGKNGYYYCNVHTGSITPCHTMTDLNLGDGHPSCCGDWIVFDSYPDKSRMQHLFLYNRKEDKVIPLLELYQSVKYMGECRCDLHPRFSRDGRYVFFDTVFTGKRAQCYIDLKDLK